MTCDSKNCYLLKELEKLLNTSDFLYRVELPKDRTVGVRADEEKNIEEVLAPILRQSGLDIKDYDICLVRERYMHNFMYK